MDEQEAFIFSVVQLQSFTSMNPFLYDFLRETAFRFFATYSHIKSTVFKLYICNRELTMYNKL